MNHDLQFFTVRLEKFIADETNKIERVISSYGGIEHRT